MDNEEAELNYQQTELVRNLQANERIIHHLPGFEQDIERLRSEGWIVGKIKPSQASILPNGRLIPVSDGGHDSIVDKYTDNTQFMLYEFIQEGGLYLSGNLIVVNDYGNVDPQLLILN